MKRNFRPKPGKKHPILFIPQSFNRVWRHLLLFDILLWVMWWFAPIGGKWLFSPPRDQHLLFAGIVVLILMLFFFVTRNWSYVQAREDHLRVEVPLYRLKIPYSLVKGIRMMEINRLVNFNRLNWADKRFLQKYRRKTVAALYLTYYPKGFLMRLFIPRYLFLPKGTGFLFLVREYMVLITEVDALLNLQQDSIPALDQTR